MVTIETIETPSLGDRTYLVHDGATAAVVDPQRDIDRVLTLLDERGLRVSHVVETHVHNDYVTGGAELARVTGARYVLSADEELHVEATGVRDGDVLTVGSFELRVMHTPGHTPTHLSYVVTADGRDVAVCTGGSLLYGSVGRTDLISRARAEELTRAQHRSARRLTSELADDVRVLPTHGFGSFCSSTSSETPTNGTIGSEREGNVACRITDEDEFVATLLAGLDAYPRYYVHMSPRNRLGPGPIDLSPATHADPQELRARIAANEWVVDLRTRTAYAAEHVRGTVNVELADSFITYLGWLVPWGSPITLVGDTPEEVADAQRDLARIGIDRPAAQATGGVAAFGGELPRGRYRVADFEQLAEARAAGKVHVLDVRRDDERRTGAVAGSQHVPLHDLERRIAEVPADREVWVHCASGYRSAIAASLLTRTGRLPVLVDDDADRIAQLGLDAAVNPPAADPASRDDEV
ncbi:MBL fold metallo-hydrolase [Nitriliruptor alkaliphilus]|uniref:MBL fold metallo-hydrolase n=1 Tax=Nitriliruptor alkaliphilus TaxID=427918 RepID=UPI000695B210|nr:MBL fold metallo-hydrolase [Nitriliruptor alkaliphilus]